MSGYPSILGVSRVPHKGEDKLVAHPDSCHIVVICNGHYYRIDILDASGKPKAIPEVRSSLHAIRAAAQAKESGPAVAALTAWTRDEWAEGNTTLNLLELDRFGLISPRES
jgi:hypothetical protein